MAFIDIISINSTNTQALCTTAETKTLPFLSSGTLPSRLKPVLQALCLLRDRAVLDDGLNSYSLDP